MTLQQIGKFTLHQDGGYVCRTMFEYVDGNGQLVESSQTGNELLGQTYTTDPGDLGVPDGSMLWMKIWVMAGTDNQARQAFLYQKNGGSVAEYTCSGTTLANHLALDGINNH